MRLLSAAGMYAVIVSGLAAQATDPPTMLERTLPGVMTIAVNEVSDRASVLGAAGSSRLNQAYERVLDLAGAKISGSGFVVTRGQKTLVVTNAHVVANAASSDEIYAYSINQTRYKLRVFGGDSFFDIALLEFVEPSKPGPEIMLLSLRETEMRIGETVYALGNPLGRFPYSVSSGIIGGKNRFLSGPTGRLGYLQHTATISHGNSGGPLIDSGGRVAGVNTSLATDEGIGQAQLNFALDGILAARLIGELIAGNGHLTRAYLGLELSQSTDLGHFRKTGESEAMIESVLPDGPAAPLAKCVGWRVDRIGQQLIRNLDEAMAAIEEIKPGQKVEFEVSAGGSANTVTIQAAILTDERKSQLVRHAMTRHLHLQVGDGDDGVTVRQSSAATPPANGGGLPKLRGVGQGSDSDMQSRTPNELMLIGVGIIPEESQSRGEVVLYKVARTPDLATSLRLLMMLGRVDFVFAAPGWERPRVAHWVPSDAPDVVKRILIC